ncbi:MAG: HpyAIV family type II restriction enzyme [candidate division WOR-3 bacterium]
MNYEKFSQILNKHIIEGEKKEILRKLANNPERFVGLFRPTRAKAKILQHLLQSHEIKMGEALEEIIEEILRELGFHILPKNLQNKKEKLFLDQYFTDGENYYFIEQKVRDDHDSSKKRGQFSNFKTKVEILYKKHKSNLIGIMYFIDPTLYKNRNYYIKEIEKLREIYKVKLYLFYGKELFEYFKCSEIWDNILRWLKTWKENLPELPEINFDKKPRNSFEEIKDLDLKTWKKLLSNRMLLEEGIINTLFPTGETLKILISFFESKEEKAYKELVKVLKNYLKILKL